MTPAPSRPRRPAHRLFQYGFFASGWTEIVRPLTALRDFAMSMISCIVRIGNLPFNAVGRWSAAS